MAKFDLHNHINPRPAFNPATATTDNTAYVSSIVDTLGFGSVELVIQTGTLADADATFTVLFEDGDQSNLSDHAEVTNTAFLLGTEALASFTFANDNQCFKIGYIGPKRYCRATITPANNTGSTQIAGVWLLGHALYEPTVNPPV